MPDARNRHVSRRHGALAPPIALAILILLLLAPAARAICVGRRAGTVFTQLDAPPGGIWWLPVRRDLVTSDVITFTSTDGSTAIDGTVVSLGAFAGVAVRVPVDAPVGAHFHASANFFDLNGGRPLADLIVVPPSPTRADEAFPTFAFVILQRPIVVGEEGVVALPPGECGEPIGIVNISREHQPFASVNVPEGFVLDLMTRTLDVQAFSGGGVGGFDSLDAQPPGHIEVELLPPTSSFNGFLVDARLRRVADGAVGRTTTLTARRITETAQQDLEFNGCTSTSGQSWFASLALGLLVRGRKPLRRALA
jgi:hypothetical protein